MCSCKCCRYIYICLCIVQIGVLSGGGLQAVCSFTYSHRDEIKALSLLYQQKGYKRCEYHIHAPRNHYIELNFTRLFGFHTQSSMTKGNLQSTRLSEKDSDNCLPPELILNENSEGSDKIQGEQIARLCTNYKNLLGPKVFHSKLNVIKITYIWVENHSSGFTVDFDFHHHNNSCVHSCDENLCLLDTQICDGHTDCTDLSDEYNCPPLSQSTGASQSSTNADVVKAVVVIISIVLMPGLFIIICIVSPCQLRSRMWRRGRRTRERNENRPESQTSEVVYVPTSGTPSTSQDKLLEQRISEVREQQLRARSVQTDTMIDLPPQIPISKDGEEGYIEGQYSLINNKRNQCFDQLFRPPPNRTVHDRESPPPYTSNSASLENLGCQPPPRIVKDSNGCPRTLRCHSMSSKLTSPCSPKSPKTVSQHEARTHWRTMSTVSPGDRARTVSATSYTDRSGDPPDYSPVYSSDMNSSHVNSLV